VTDDGWYADPTERYAERLFVAGGWTRRVRVADGTELTEGTDHTGAISRAGHPPPPRDWSVERPSFGLAVAVLAVVLAALGFLVLDWTAGAGFPDVRRSVRLDPDRYGVVTQVYVRLLYLPLLVATIATGLFASVGRRVARIATGAAGVLGGIGLVAVVIWVESGGVGTDDSRHDALALLVVMALAGVASVICGVGAWFEDRAVLARGLAATLAALAVILHVYVVEDLFAGSPEPAFGAWAAALGFALLAIAPAVPYRRIEHAPV
jgi:hypothetical protein